MISPAEAANKVKQTQNYEWVTKVVDFDAQHYVVEALPEVGKLATGCQTTFGVDKNSGQVTAFMMNDAAKRNKFINAKSLPFE